MTFKVIIQSRMSSKRFPGKMMAPFLGKPMIANVVENVKRSKLNFQIILATSDDYTDDPLALYGKHLGLAVVRGPRENVFERFLLALNKYNCEAFFRVCGDSPLILPDLFDLAISIYKHNPYDIITNIFPRTFPSGLSIELINTKTFYEIKNKILKKDDQEHVTKYFYDHSSDFEIYNIQCKSSKDQAISLAVDELSDLKRIEKWYLNNSQNYQNLFPIKTLK